MIWNPPFLVKIVKLGSVLVEFKHGLNIFFFEEHMGLRWNLHCTPISCAWAKYLFLLYIVRSCLVLFLSPLCCALQLSPCSSEHVTWNFILRCSAQFVPIVGSWWGQDAPHGWWLINESDESSCCLESDYQISWGFIGSSSLLFSSCFVFSSPFVYVLLQTFKISYSGESCISFVHVCCVLHTLH